MIQSNIKKIKNKISSNNSLQEGNKQELLDIVSELETEISELSKTESDHAESITHFASASTHEAIREDTNPQLLKLALEGLSHSVKGFEISHPKLTEEVNRIANVLAGMGI